MGTSATGCDITVIGSIATSIGVVVAIVFSTLNYRIVVRSNSAKMVLDLSNRFNSTEMRQHRKQLAAALLADREAVNLEDDQPVLMFFEELAYMNRMKVLDIGMVWNTFFYDVDTYVRALTEPPNLIEKLQKDAANLCVYEELPKLHQRLVRFYKRQHGGRFRPHADIQKQLKDEVALVVSSR